MSTNRVSPTTGSISSGYKASPGITINLTPCSSTMRGSRLGTRRILLPGGPELPESEPVPFETRFILSNGRWRPDVVNP